MSESQKISLHLKHLIERSVFADFSAHQLGLLADVQSIEPLKMLFNDSSCDVWRLNKAAGQKSLIAKTFKEQEHRSPFWLAMSELFAVDLLQSLYKAPQFYPLVQSLSCLEVPKVAGSEMHNDRAFVVLSELFGESVVADEVSDKQVEQLAQFMAGMHQVSAVKTGALWSNIETGELIDSAAEDWKLALKRCFSRLELTQNLGEIESRNIEKQLESIGSERVVPLMMDLRWDQFAAKDSQLVGLFDLDAYVFAPVELDFVMLEYLLDKSQLELFKNSYQAWSEYSIPDLEKVREVYRTLFYLMNALGEPDYEKWMARPKLF